MSNTLLDKAFTHHRDGQLAEAERLYRTVLDAEPTNAEAWHMIGVLAGQVGKTEEAVRFFTRAVELQPDNAAYLHNLGEAYRVLGSFINARNCFLQAIALAPDLPDSYGDLAKAFQEEAIRAQQPIFLRDATSMRTLQGNCYARMQRPHDAVTAYQQAIAIDPNYALAYSSLGDVLRLVGKTAESEAVCRQALTLDPKLGAAYNNLGNALNEQGKWQEAERCYLKAMALDPSLEAAVTHNLGEGAFYIINTRSDLSREEIFQRHQTWGNSIVAALPPPAPWQNDRSTDRPLRVGYVSPDFKEHSVNFFFEPLLATLDWTKIIPFCYSDVANPDLVTQRLKAKAAAWRPIFGRSNTEVADLIRKDEIDILVDLAGHTQDNRLKLFAMKPAPLTVNWLGYPNTSGLPNMDYRLTDAVADPPGESDHLHSETLLRLDGSFLCYRPPKNAPAIQECPLRNPGEITFGSFNALGRITNEVIDSWVQILRQLPASRMIFKAKQLSDTVLQERFTQRLIEAGAGPEQLDVRGFTESVETHLSLYNEIDVALDSFPFNGTTTVCEALWMGVPLVTLAGDRHSGRTGASILTMIGHKELITDTKHAYRDTAIGLARDPERIAVYHRTLRGDMARSVLCDEAGFAVKMEKLFRKIWKDWVKNNP